ncbi:hypothetical protein ACFQ7A_04755 [Streptomyces sp. NPDC056528]|uniref:hypothetical protein n=1 Tax=Streptomyces sp. NPDC056528 TaxID=3345854 RepID=UPI0036A2DFFE
MVQIRVMSDDKALGEKVLAVLLPLLEACTALEAGEPTRLRHREGGLRVVLDVKLARPGRVTVERDDSPPARPVEWPALPPGRGRGLRR